MVLSENVSTPFLHNQSGEVSRGEPPAHYDTEMVMHINRSLLLYVAKHTCSASQLAGLPRSQTVGRIVWVVRIYAKIIVEKNMTSVPLVELPPTISLETYILANSIGGSTVGTDHSILLGQ